MPIQRLYKYGISDTLIAPRLRQTKRIQVLKFRVDLGDEEREILAGIRSAYDPDTLEGRLVVVVANLTPRKMRFGTSEGMVLAAGGKEGLFLLQPDDGARPGMRVT